MRVGLKGWASHPEVIETDNRIYKFTKGSQIKTRSGEARTYRSHIALDDFGNVDGHFHLHLLGRGRD